MKIIQTFLFESDFFEKIRHKLSFIYQKIVKYSTILATGITLKTLSSWQIYKKTKKNKKKT
jgi:hypothetical protein